MQQMTRGVRSRGCTARAARPPPLVASCTAAARCAAYGCIRAPTVVLLRPEILPGGPGPGSGLTARGAAPTLAGTRMADRAALPAGTVTFLFTDLGGSTRLLQAHPAAYRDAVRRHHALLRGAEEGHGGAVFETVGDAVYAAFARPGARPPLGARRLGRRRRPSRDPVLVPASRVRADALGPAPPAPAPGPARPPGGSICRSASTAPPPPDAGRGLERRRRRRAEGLVPGDHGTTPRPTERAHVDDLNRHRF
jgi:class 3 adenylate cyclase